MRLDMWTIGAALLLACAPAAVGAQQPACAAGPTTLPATDRALVRRIDSMATAFMKAERVPGLSVGVVRCGRTLVGKGYGMADVEHGARATPTTLFRLGSISKPFAAVLAAKLAEQGKLDLDAPIQRYVPRFPEKSAPVTARQLMSHTSGVRHYRGDEISLARQFPGLDSALSIFAADSLMHAPGSGYTYSTYGYTLLGVAIERACGTTFTACLVREILAPAGLRDVREDRQAEIIPGRARPYRVDSAGTLLNAGLANTSYKVPGGGLIASGEAVAHFGDAAMRGMLVTPATWARMTTRVRTSDGREQAYGEGWQLGGRPELLPGVVMHSGSQQGTSTMLYLVPSHGVSVAVLANLENVGGRKLQVLTDAMARAAIPRVVSR